jgi:ATP-dependent DNA helicase
MYHGSPVERAELRRTVIPLPDQRASAKHTKSSIPVSGHKESLNTSERKYPVTDPGRRIFRKQSEDDDDIITDVGSAHDESNDEASFPVVITTYEMIIKDRVHLSAYDFSYIG